MPDTAGFDISGFPGVQLGLLYLIGLVVLLLCIWGVIKIAEANRDRAKTPQEKLMGKLGRVLSPIGPTQQGKIHVFGEIWDALADDESQQELIQPPAEVRVVGINATDSQVLRVIPLSRSGLETD